VQRLIKAAVDRGASVIHIKAGDVLRARIEGKIVKLSNQVFTEEETVKIALKLIPSEKDRERFDRQATASCWSPGRWARARAPRRRP
jgi:twitching motility protein PilT